MPEWLIKACLKPDPPPPSPPRPHRPALAGDGTPYGIKALTEECNAIERAPFGQQELTLNNAALKIGSLVAAGELLEGYALSELIAAGNALSSESGREPWQAAEIEKKVRRGLEDGKRTQRAVPPSQPAGNRSNTTTSPPTGWGTQHPPRDEASAKTRDGAQQKPDENPKAGLEELPEHLSAAAWISRDLPPPDNLLGELLSTTSRVFLVGQTGLGKTNLGMAMAVGMATGSGFLHWSCARASRVLYIDGEMPAELLKTRLTDALRRADCGESPPEGLFLFSRDQDEDVAKRWPMLGTLPALNTDEGQRFIRLLCDTLKPDCIIFDNVMGLIVGDQKDEVPWSETLPLVADLTRRRVGQLWIDHTGHNTERQYGSSTKAWRFDAVGIMTPLPDDKRNVSELAFALSFDHPGKARRRTPDNWHEFAPHIIRLRDDRWTSEPSDGKASKAKVPPLAQRFHEALLDAIVKNATRPGATTMATWESECIRRDLIDAPEPDETAKARHVRYATWRKARTQLLAARWIGIDGDRVTDLTQDYWRGS